MASCRQCLLYVFNVCSASAREPHMHMQQQLPRSTAGAMERVCVNQSCDNNQHGHWSIEYDVQHAATRHTYTDSCALW